MGALNEFYSILNYTIHNNTLDGIEVSDIDPVETLVITNCNITGNGAYGLDVTVSTQAVVDTMVALVDYNNFGTGGTANTSGARNGISAGANDIAADPGYASAGTGDFSCGTGVKALGFPDASRTVGANQSNTTTYVDIGGAQREEPAGGGSASVLGGGALNGGFSG